VRVNATATDIRFRHAVTECAADGGLTIRYADGPKAGLDIHFFTERELTELTGAQFTPVLAPRLASTPHPPPVAGQWSQWEAIWLRSAAPAPAPG